MKTTKYILFSIFAMALFACSENKSEENNDISILKEGYWEGTLSVQDHPVSFIFYVENDQIKTLYNSDEKIEMQELVFQGDSVQVYFQNYPTFLKFKIETDEKLSGYYLHPDIGAELQYPLVANFLGKYYEKPIDYENMVYEIAGNWETYFRPNTPQVYPSVGQFYQLGNRIKGTFLKPSGDARFLEGTLNDNKLMLSSFDGSYVALYIAELINDTLWGKYISRKTGEIEWMAVRNNDFQLTDSDKRTQLVHDDFTLNLKQLNGEDYSYPNDQLNGKTVIIQILGTWCPNCLDEGDFFKTLYEKYKDKGLEIIGVAYERPQEFDEQVARVERLIKNREYPYPILIGGDLASNKVAQDFSILDKISAFPTSIFINKKGEIVRIETGFSGPGTGELYHNHIENITNFVEELLEM